MQDNIFSSKPKQISQAAVQILSKVYGSIDNVNLIVISDMKLPLNIAENLKKLGLKDFNFLEDPFDKFFNKTEKQLSKSEKFLKAFSQYDVIMIGYKDQKKLIDVSLVRKILKKRKQRPIFFIDCGIPGNVDTRISKIHSSYLFDLNDLEQLYTSWTQNVVINEESLKIIYDIQLKSFLDSFFHKLKFNLEQKTIFEKRINLLLKSNINEFKISLKNFLKYFQDG